MPLINNIPENYEEGFKELNSLTDIQFHKISEGLSNSPLVSSIEGLASDFLDIEELEGIDVEDIFLSVGGLIPYLEREEMIDEVVEDITFISILNEFIKEEHQQKFKEKLNFLLRNKQIYFASKASDLLNNYGNVFLNSRVITDVRPIFDMNLETQPTGAVVLHSLNVHYQSNDEPFHKDITLILSPNDIQSLIDTLIRAQKKELSLSGFFKKKGIENLG